MTLLPMYRSRAMGSQMCSLQRIICRRKLASLQQAFYNLPVFRDVSRHLAGTLQEDSGLVIFVHHDLDHLWSLAGRCHVELMAIDYTRVMGIEHASVMGVEHAKLER